MIDPSTLSPGDQVALTVRGAVDFVGDHAIFLHVEGLEDLLEMPFVTDDGAPLHAVTVQQRPPSVQPGDVWSTRNGKTVLMGASADGITYLVDEGARLWTPTQAVDQYGPMELRVRRTEDRPDTLAELPADPPLYRQTSGGPFAPDLDAAHPYPGFVEPERPMIRLVDPGPVSDPTAGAREDDTTVIPAVRGDQATSVMAQVEDDRA